MLAVLQINAKYNDFFLAPNANAISNTSGGMGKKEDSEKKEFVEIVNQADQMIHQTEKQINELKDKLSKEDVKEINNKLDDLSTELSLIYPNYRLASLENFVKHIWKVKAFTVFDVFMDHSAVYT